MNYFIINITFISIFFLKKTIHYLHLILKYLIYFYFLLSYHHLITPLMLKRVIFFL